MVLLTFHDSSIFCNCNKFPFTLWYTRVQWMIASIVTVHIRYIHNRYTDGHLQRVTINCLVTFAGGNQEENDVTWGKDQSPLNYIVPYLLLLKCADKSYVNLCQIYTVQRVKSQSDTRKHTHRQTDFERSSNISFFLYKYISSYSSFIPCHVGHPCNNTNSCRPVGTD